MPKRVRNLSHCKARHDRADNRDQKIQTMTDRRRPASSTATKSLGAAVLLVSMLAGCATTDDTTRPAATPVGPAPTYAVTQMESALKCLSGVYPAAADLRIGVNDLTDGTGATLSGDTFSKMLTQRPDMMMTIALAKTGARVVNRSSTGVSEWELKQAMQKYIGDGKSRINPASKEPIPYRPILAGSLLGSTHYVSGAISELNWNIKSDVSEFGIGGLTLGGRNYRISLGVDLIVTNTTTTEVVMARSYSKQLVGREVSSGLFRFFDVGRASKNFGPREVFEFNLGRQANEPVQTAVRWILETAAYEIVSSLSGVGSSCDDLLPEGSRPERAEQLARPAPVSQGIPRNAPGAPLVPPTAAVAAVPLTQPAPTGGALRAVRTTSGSPSPMPPAAGLAPALSAAVSPGDMSGRAADASRAEAGSRGTTKSWPVEAKAPKPGTASRQDPGAAKVVSASSRNATAAGKATPRELARNGAAAGNKGKASADTRKVAAGARTEPAARGKGQRNETASTTVSGRAASRVAAAPNGTPVRSTAAATNGAGEPISAASPTVAVVAPIPAPGATGSNRPETSAASQASALQPAGVAQASPVAGAAAPTSPVVSAAAPTNPAAGGAALANPAASGAAPTSTGLPPTAQARPAATGAGVGLPTNVIEGVNLIEDENETVIRVDLRVPLDNLPAIDATQPRTLVVALPRVANGIGRILNLAGAGVQAVRLDSDNGATRLLIDLDGPFEHTVDRNGRSLLVTLKGTESARISSASGQAPGQGAALKAAGPAPSASAAAASTGPDAGSVSGSEELARSRGTDPLTQEQIAQSRRR